MPRRTRRAPVLGAGFIALVAAGLLPTVARAAPPDPPPPQSTAAFCAGTPAGDPFTDVDPTNAHYDTIRCLVHGGITTGQTATTYNPRGEVTRQQMASFVTRLIDLANRQEAVALKNLPAYDGTPDFDDVDPESPHFTAVMRLSQAGIVNGTGPRRYSPAGRVTREQMAAFINRTAQFLTGAAYSSSSDYFTDDEASTFEADINGIASRGIAVGDGRDSYGPGRVVVRDQMASFLVRTLAVLHKDGKIKPLAEGAEASDGAINGTGTGTQSDTNKGAQVAKTDKASDSFEACDITVLADVLDTTNPDRCFTYRYDSGDSFTVDGGNADLAAFEAALSPYDDITGTYARDGASTFALHNEAPTGPEGVTAAAEWDRVTLTIDDSATPSVDTYLVDRATANSLLGCASQAVTYERIGTASDPTPGADSGDAVYPDTTVEPNTDYCYRVTARDDGDDSTESVTTGLVATPARPASASTPRAMDVRLVHGNGQSGDALERIDAGDRIVLAFDVPMAAPDQDDAIRVTDGDGTIADIACGSPGSPPLVPPSGNGCTRNSSTQTVGATSYPANHVVTITLAATPTPSTAGSETGVAEPSVIIDESGFTSSEGSAWSLATSRDLEIDKETGAPRTIQVRHENGTNSGNFANQVDAGDTVYLVFDESMATPVAGDAFTAKDADGTTATITCRTLPPSSVLGPEGLSCTRNASEQSVAGTAYPAGRVITVVLTEQPSVSEAGTITGLQVGAQIQSQVGYTDLAGNPWNVPDSPDRSIN